MQFSHVSDMSSEEILDYAVLYGNEASNLNIKSFNNLSVRDYNQDDWISIFIDLIVYILGAENPLMLRTHVSTKGTNCSALCSKLETNKDKVSLKSNFVSLSLFILDLFEPVDQLLFRNAAFELLSNPTKKYCIPCRTVFPYSTSSEIEEFELHSQEHSIKKEESAGLLSCTGEFLSYTRGDFEFLKNTSFWISYQYFF